MSIKNTFAQLLVASLFLFISCDDGDDATDSGNQKCLLEKQISPTLTMTITRDGKGLATSIAYDYKSGDVVYETSSTVEYDASDRVTKITGDDYSFTYEYDSQGRVVLESYSSVEDPTRIYTYPYERTFSYNASGQLVKIAYDADNFDRYEYEAGGNLVRQFSQTAAQAEYLKTEYLDYDDKKSPYVDFPFQYNIYLLTSEVGAIITSVRPVVNANNIVSVKTYLPAGSSTLANVTYTYNNSGYPTLISESNTSFVYACK